MYSRIVLALFALATAPVFAATAETSMPTSVESPAERRIAYPESLRVDQVDEYHGVKVADPYRWLEDLDSAQTGAWVAAQNKVTSAYLAAIPERDAIRQRLTQLWNYERYGVPNRHGGRYFFTRNDGLQNQNVLYFLDTLGGEPKVVLDPNTLSADGTVALSGVSVSEDGKLVAYGLSSGGSDWQEWKVREVESGRDLPDHLRWVKFSTAAWTHDGKGFFYSRYDEPGEGRQLEEANFFQKLYYHRLGTAQSEDELVYHRPDRKELGFAPIVTEDGRYLVIHAWLGTETENGIFYKDLQTSGSPVVDLLGGFDAAYNFIGNDGPLFWFMTDSAAPRGRVIAVDLREPARERWRELIPQTAETLRGVACLNGTFLALYLKDAHSQVRRFDLGGKFLRQLELPGLGSVDGFTGKREDRETFYSFTSYTTPGTIYRYDLETGKSTVFREPRIEGFDSGRYETRQVFFPSKDGTRIPMFLTYRKGLKLNGANPVFLHGYGGFNVSLTPSFSVPQVVWMEHGGIYADGQPARRWRIWGGVAPGRQQAEEAERLRRFHRRRRVAHRQRLYLPPEAGDRRQQQRRSAHGRLHGAAARPLRRGHRQRRRAGHAALPQVHHRLGLDLRLRLAGRSAGVQGAVRLLALPQSAAGHRLPADADHHRRPR